MKFKNIFKVVAIGLASLALATSCAEKEFDEITELNLDRCLEPQNLSAKVDAATGDNVTFAWDVNKDAENYNLVVYNDEAMTSEALNVTVPASEVPYTVRLTADQKYYFKVQALSEARSASNWAIYDSSCKTYAVKDNLFLEVSDRTPSSLSLSWSKDADDYTEVTHIAAIPVKGGKTVEVELSSAQASAAAAVVEGLASSTEYQVTLYYMSAARGSVDAWTKADQGSATKVSTSEELVALMTAGDNIYLSLEGSPYTISNVKPAGSVKLVGEIGADGTKPVVTGKIELTDALASGSEIYLEGITFDGGGTNSRLIEHTGGSPVLSSIKVVGCDITNYLAGLFYGNNNNVIKIGEFLFDSCDMYSILGSGGDAVDIRKTTEIDRLAFLNNTIYNGIRTMFRIDASDAIKIGTLDFENNTVKNIATMDDGNNRGFFATRVAMDMILKNNLFLYEDGGKKGEGETDRAQLFQENANTVVPNLTASDNYSFASGKSFFSKVSAATAGFTELEADPCYNSKGNFFQLANNDLASKKVGASKWWIAYVEKEEDLTQDVIDEAHVWNLQDASLFAGEVKNSRVRDGLLLVGSEAVPMNADGGVNFLSASTLTRKGVPTDGYAAFKIDAPGSVDILVSDPQGTGASVVVALADDNGLSVKGGAVAAATNGSVEKIIINKVSGEGTVYLYSTGAVNITKLAWSEDVTGGNKVLAAPKPEVEPVTISEGEATAVAVTWSAVPNAAGYIVVFNKKAYEQQTELSFNVPAEEVAELKAGLYNFTVQAIPADGDIYYQKSELGSAAIAIQPKGGEEGGVEVVKTWDFSGADWQAEFAKLGEAGKDLEILWNLTIDGLNFSSTLKNRYTAKALQIAGGGSKTERVLTFDIPADGTVKVWASNTGSSEDLSRQVVVASGDEEGVAQPGGTPSNADPTVNEYSVKAGKVYIYTTGALRIYKVEVTYTTGPAPKVDLVWDFSGADWQAEFAKLGESGKDLEILWNLTIDGLNFSSTLKNRYTAKALQIAGGGSKTERVLTFDAPADGTVIVKCSNTGSSEDLSRQVVVASGDEEGVAQPGGTPSNADPTVNEYSVKAGKVYIYTTGALRIYSVEFHS